MRPLVPLTGLALCATAYLAASDDAGAQFAPLADGATDATATIQSALDAAGAAGGGIVSLPIGQFRLDGTLTIPNGVTLQGVWRSPHFSYPNMGTTLLAYAGRGLDDGPPLIMLESNTAVCGLTIYYPEQRVSEIQPYPWAIQGRGTHVNVSDVTLLNPYKGIDFGTYSHEMHYIRNVYGCPLKIGVHLDKCTDIGRVENVHFNPNSWTRSGTPTSPTSGEDGQKLVEWLQTQVTAFEIGRSDWEYMLNTFSWGCHIGYRFYKSDNGPTNGNFLGIAADWAVIPILVEETQGPGLLITNGQFVGSPACEAVVKIADTHTGVVQFSNCSFWGPHQKVVEAAGQGSVSLSQCNFCQWASRPRRGPEAPSYVTDAAEVAAGVPAVDVLSGSVIIQGCMFHEDKLQIRLAEDVRSAVIMGNQHRGGIRVESHAKGDVQILGNVVVP